MISVICVYNDETQYMNMVASLGSDEYELSPVNNCNGQFSSAAQALNYGAEKSTGDVLIFCHQDVLFKSESVAKLTEPVTRDLSKPVIVGSAGAGLVGKNAGGEYFSVKSLDECCCAVSRKTWEKFKFNEDLCDGWHLYVVELCIRIRAGGGLCLTGKDMQIRHLSFGNVNKAYMQTYRKLQKAYKDENPLVTTCKSLRNNAVSFYAYYLIWKLKKLTLGNYPIVHKIKTLIGSHKDTKRN